MTDSIAKIYLCSGSQLKHRVTQEFFDTFSKVVGTTYDVIKNKLDYCTVEQPVNEGITSACQQRIDHMKDHLRNLKIQLGDRDMIVALENGVHIDEKRDTCHDICILIVHYRGVVNRYNSFGIQIDRNLFDLYLNEVLEIDSDKDKVLEGFDQTFGDFLSRYFNIAPDNWMSDPRFGDIDRGDQIMDCFKKFMLDFCTDIVPDYPRKGVIFKDVTSVTIHPQLLQTLYDLMERFIRDNYDVESIDYFAGLDARGFYFAPVMARVFNKGFIPVRKTKKVPRTDEQQIISEKYSTEYSEDSFGLTLREEYHHKKVLIIDDLLATGRSLIEAVSVLKKCNMKVISGLSVYDVADLRGLAEKNLKLNDIKYKVLLNENNNVPNDFTDLHYEIPDTMITRLRAQRADYGSPSIDRNYTLTSNEWLKMDDMNDMTDLDTIKKIDNSKMKKVKVIYTEKDRNLAEKILNVLAKQTGANVDTETCEVNITNGLFSNGETRVEINTNIRNKHVIVICQTRTNHINNDLMELFMIMDACSRAEASKVTVVMPYYPYSRSDKKDAPRCAIGASVVANILKKLDVSNLISVDLHAGQIQGFIDKGFHNLYIRSYMCDYIHRNYLRFYSPEHWNDHFILIAPDAGSGKAIKSYSKILGINNIILDKQRDYTKPGTVLQSRFIGEKSDFKGKTGLIIDDMADTMGTMCAASKELVENGMKDVIVFVTHGILSGPAIERINTTPYIKEVVVTDTLPQQENINRSPKIRVLTSSELIARGIDGILTGRSISRLF